MLQKSTEEIIVDFRTYLESTKSPSTIPSYMSRISLWILYVDKEILSLESPTVDDVIKFIDNYRTVKGEPWAESTKEQIKIILLTFYNFMVNTGLIDKNSLDNGLNIKLIRTESQIYSDDEIQAVINFLSDEELFNSKIENYKFKLDYLAATLIFRDTGLRIAYVLPLTINQVRPNKKLIESTSTSPSYISYETANILRQLIRGKEPDDWLLEISESSLRSIYLQMSEILHFRIFANRFRTTWLSKIQEIEKEFEPKIRRKIFKEI